MRRAAPRRRARRRPADLGDARPARHRAASSAAACGSPRPRRWTSSAWCSSARSTASSSACINAHGPLAVGTLGRGRRAVPAASPDGLVDGVEVDLGLVGDVVEVDPRAVPRLLDAGRIPVVSTIAPDVDDRARRYNVNADTAAARARRRARRREARLPHRRRGPLRATGRTRDSLARRDRLPPRCAALLPDAWVRHDPQDGGVPAGRRRRRAAAHVLDGRAPHSSCSRSSPTPGSRHDGRCRRRGADRRRIDAPPARDRLRAANARAARRARPRALMDTFGTPPLELVRGEGV